MTTTQSLTNHHLTVDLDEDNMEMATSPYREIHDDDIDFELDDHREHSVEDNSMIDDTTENLDTNPNQDDLMLYDDDNDLVDFDEDLPMEPNESSYIHHHDIHEGETAPAVESESHDRFLRDASFEDADLTADDAKSMNGGGGEDYLQEEATNVEFTIAEDEATTINVEENDTHTQDETYHKQADIVAEEENPAEIQTTDVKDFAAEASSEEAAGEKTEYPQDEHSPNHVEPSVEATGSPKLHVENGHVETSATELDEHVEGPDSEAEAKAEALTSNETQKSPQREATPVNLHPVTVRYNGEDCWLFPPLDIRENKHVFLDDPTLASEPFDRLIAALRTTLINDQEMADHDEIVLDIPVLGLHICEDSKHASLLNLSRVIDIYMMLSQNEGLTVFEPLYCELSTRVCLADQFAYIEDAAFVQRITYTDFVAEQAGSPGEVPQNDDNIVQEEEEETRADVSTYYDAADDHDDGEEPLTTLVEVQEAETRIRDGAVDDVVQVSHSKPEAEILDEHAGEEDSRTHVNEIRRSPDFQPKPDSDEPTFVAEVDDDLQEPQGQSHVNDKEPLQHQQDETTAKQSSETPVQFEPEADEDLFADDPVEPELSDPEAEKTVQVPEVHSDGVSQEHLESIEDNDDFDFNDWSDDEQDVTKTEEVSAILSTPSKSINSKRKLIGDDDDFLEIDVSTPEPKRPRQS